MAQDPIWAANSNQSHVGGPVTGTDLGGGKRGLDTSSAQLATRIDEATSTVTYIGVAAPGSTNSQSVWQIKRITVSGSVTSIEFADGNAGFDNVWNDRASLTYS